jgi:DNA (cytosine-5)-methyltransferase 1
MVAIDLFSGAGGMSLGFKQAGYKVRGAFDIEDRNIETYKHNFPETRGFVSDLSVLRGAEIRKLSQTAKVDIDVLFGGPPCQGFSMAGRRMKNDPRNMLLSHFGRLVKELEPRYFIVENVAGLMMGHGRESLDKFLKIVSRSGYKVVEPIRILNAADFGVPQRRKRTFILGYHKTNRAPRYPIPKGLINERGKEVFPKVKDAILDLPAIERFDHLFEFDEADYTSSAKSYYAKLMRGEVSDLEDKLKPERRNTEKITGCLRTKHSKETMRRFSKTKPGKIETISQFYRLDLEDVSPTLRAGTANDHGSHTAPRPIHPTIPRCITVREAARLHSYPDWYRFHNTRWHGFRQVGNSVPPLLARAVASSLLKLS